MREKINRKKAISHVEVILSFTIFIGFLIFLFVIFKPFGGFNKEDIYVDIVERGIINHTLSEVVAFSLKLKNPIEERFSCFGFEYDVDNGVVVKNESYDLVNSCVEKKGSKSTIYIEGKGIFFNIYSNELFETDDSFDSEKCKKLKEDRDYVLGLVRKYGMLSRERLIQLKERCKNAETYEELKKKFGIPSSKEFAFSVKDTLGKELEDLELSKEVPEGIRVTARSLPIQLVYANGDMRYAILNVRVW